MHHRAIGDTTATVVGIGDVRLSLADARGVSPSDVDRSVQQALELGISLIDSAQDAERLCGDALRVLRLRDRVVLTTHVPVLVELFGRPRHHLHELLPVGHVQERVEASLRATRQDALSLAFLPVRPGWASSRAWPELLGTCGRLVREGKVLRWGARLELSTDEEVAEASLLGEPFVALSVVFNACERRALPLLSGTLPVLAREPLAGAALAGTIGPGVKLNPRDDRRHEAAMLERIAAGAARLALLVRDEPPAVRSCDAARAAFETGKRPPYFEALSVAELALRFAIDRGAIVLPRLHRREHVPDAVAAGSAQPLSPAVHTAIERAFS